MNFACPCCHAELTLDVLLSTEHARQSVARLVGDRLGFGAVGLRYIALFRPLKRRMSIERMVTLIDELLPDIERGAIARKGRDWPAPREVWRAGMETVLAKRDKEALTLPLASHGLLYEVMCALADKAEALAEKQREEDRAARRAAGPAAEPVAAGASLVTVLHTTTPPAAYSAGPSKAAQRIKAEAAERLARRGGAVGDSPGESA